jgi:bifunctional non-homologous end joining protein LigD
MQAPEALRQPFTDPAWLYELKFDGYRCMAGIEKAAEPPQTRLQLATDSVMRVRLLTKSGTDCTLWFPEIAEALVALPGGPHVIDGEVCVMRPDGTSDFNLLQARARRRRPYPGGPQVTFCCFDLLLCNGKPTTQLALTRRKELLGELLKFIPAPSPWILFVQDLPADADLFRSMTLPPPAGLGLEIEGVIAKRRDSIYQPGVRSPDWQKIKRPGWQEGRNWRN